MITADQAMSVLDYSPETGLFTWKRQMAFHIKNGSIAGHINKLGYVHIKLLGRLYLGHRLAWLIYYGEHPKLNIDHINGIRNDNRIANIRCVSQKENNRNQAIPVTNKSGVIGVCRNVSRGKWQAQIRVDDLQIYLGVFDSIFDAAAARKSAEIKHGFHVNHGRSQ